VKKALDIGGRESLLQWLRDIDVENTPPKSISTYIDYLLKILDHVSWYLVVDNFTILVWLRFSFVRFLQATWSVDSVVSTRVDKVSIHSLCTRNCFASTLTFSISFKTVNSQNL
jgi:hypothetical protein